MIRLQGKLDREVYVACSGGVDSMAVVDFLKNNHDVTLVFFNHGTKTSDNALNFVADYADKNGLPFMYGTLGTRAAEGKPKNDSWEEYWRKERYRFFHTIHADIITAHHLDDCVETWVWSSMHGTGKIIPYRNRNVIRPFRLTRKRDLQLWANLKNVPYVEDDTNADLCYTRNYIRHEMMPHVLRVNPGIHKTISKKVKDEHTARTTV
jgi:tRNA(Ile)-lysidine synthase